MPSNLECIVLSLYEQKEFYQLALTAIDQNSFQLVSSHILNQFLDQSVIDKDDYAVFNVEQRPVAEVKSFEKANAYLDSASSEADWKDKAASLIAVLLRLDQSSVDTLPVVPFLPEQLLNRVSLVCLLYGRLLFRLGRTDDAINALMKGMRLEPTAGMLHREYALAMRQKGLLKQAGMHFELACELRRGCGVDGGRQNGAALICRPNPQIQIYQYKDSFYVVNIDAKSTQPRVMIIAGELLEIRNNLMFKFIRFVKRLPLIRSLVWRLWYIIERSDTTTDNFFIPLKASGTLRISKFPLFKNRIIKSLYSIIKFILLLTIAQRVRISANTLPAALESVINSNPIQA
jgi:hypothetical protein